MRNDDKDGNEPLSGEFFAAGDLDPGQEAALDREEVWLEQLLATGGLDIDPDELPVVGVAFVVSAAGFDGGAVIEIPDDDPSAEVIRRALEEVEGGGLGPNASVVEGSCERIDSDVPELPKPEDDM